jgi:protein-S-isoprenylcysteine O-methyltransferase Ste14
MKMVLKNQDNTELNTTSETQETNEDDSPKGVKERLLDLVGWLMLFFQSVPALFIWGGLMTLPFALYLLIMFFSFGQAEVPLVTDRGQFYFLEALDVFFFGGNRIPEMIVSFTGLFILLYSVLFLRFRKPEGLVRSGPYKCVRHPQYLGVIVFTANLTSRCFRETLGDVGWIGPEWTFSLWFVTLLAYIALAIVEERHLSHKFGIQYDEYREDVAFIFPYVKTKRRSVEVVITLVAAVLLMFGTAILAELMPP